METTTPMMFKDFGVLKCCEDLPERNHGPKRIQKVENWKIWETQKLHKNCKLPLGISATTNLLLQKLSGPNRTLPLPSRTRGAPWDPLGPNGAPMGPKWAPFGPNSTGLAVCGPRGAQGRCPREMSKRSNGSRRWGRCPVEQPQPNEHVCARGLR